MLVPSFWSRLYLDTGDLIQIADGRADPALVAELVAACEAHIVWLVLSSAHLLDALTSDDPGSIDRLASALERFRYRCIVTSGPESIEPWPNAGTAQDVDIEACSNIREFLTHPARISELTPMRKVQNALYGAAVGTQIARRVVTTIPRRHRSVVLSSTITHILGSHTNDRTSVVLDHLEREGGSPSIQEAANLVIDQLPIAELMHEIGPTLDEHGIDRADLARRMAFSMASDGYKLAPGAWLAGKLQARLVGGGERPPRRSDIGDCLHAMLLPYVDIASCDAQAYAVLRKHVAQAAGSRKRAVSLFQNERLGDIVEHIRTLPTAAEVARAVASETRTD